ncbi:MAG TPA: hypothetical protein VG798_01295 [Rhizomicrobium sp.]|nr:hypothetical protein [Rhizomicrobium sp.]
MTLQAGAIAFTGFNGDGGDNLAFVTMQDITAGTVIYFTDNKWTGLAFANTESVWSWTAGSDLAAGSVVTLDALNTASATSNLGTVSFLQGTSANIDSGLEVVYAPQLSPWIPTRNGPRFGSTSFDDYMHAINTAANWSAEHTVTTIDAGSNGVAPDLPFPTYGFSIDPTAQIVDFAASGLSVTHAEGSDGTTTTFTFTVERANGTAGDLSFTAAIKPEHFYGAVDAADFGGALPAVNGVIADGQASVTVSVTVTGDVVYEPDETFHLALVSASNPDASSVVIGTNTTATGTVTNDDAEPGEIFAGQTVSREIFLNGTDFVTIDAGGALDLSATGIGGTAIDWQNGAATVDNSGQVLTTTNGTALLADKNVTGSLTFINHQGALSYGDVDLHKADPSAVVTVANAGTISSNSSKTIEMPNAAATGQDWVNNLATGLISNDMPGQDILRGGQNNEIDNEGRIAAVPDLPNSNGGDAVDFQSNTGGLVHNEAGGWIEGSRHAITGDFAVTVINDAGATLVGRNGSGVNIDNDANVANTEHVTNHGDIFGESQNYADSDGDAIDADGLVRVDNYGTIKGLGANGTHDGGANVSEGVAIGGGVIDNFAGGLIYGYGRAIQVDDSAEGPALGATTITNEGTIQGDGHGPTNFAPGSDVGIFLAGREAIDIIGSYADTITNKGVIVGGVFTDGGDDTFIAYAGSSASGPIDLGDGSDVLDLAGSGEGSLGATANIETVSLLGGDWTLGSEAFDSVAFTGGLNLGLALSTLSDGHFDGTIMDFASGDQIDLQGVGLETQAVLGAGNLLTLTGGAEALTLQFDPAQDLGGDVFRLATDNTGGTILTLEADQAPVFSSPAEFALAENMTAAGTVAASDPEHDGFHFGLAGGDDAAFFAIDPDSGALRFLASPDFETPADADHDNVYDLVVSATDIYGAVQTQAISVDVTDVSETGTGFSGANGRELLTGTTGGDTMNGAGGNDTVDGGDGNDIVSGGAGSDSLAGGRGDDSLDGAAGNDAMDGGVGDNNLSGGGGKDTLAGGDGDDTITGDAGADIIHGGGGHDLLAGGAGADLLVAGAGASALSGGDGNDTLMAGSGDNTFIGGTGHDIFVFGADFGKDLIDDFSHGDHIEFDGVFADFAALEAASHQAGADVVISLDADHSVTVAGAAFSGLHDADFVLH